MFRKQDSCHKNTSINILQTFNTEQYPIFTDLYNCLPEYKKQEENVDGYKVENNFSTFKILLMQSQQIVLMRNQKM